MADSARDGGKWDALQRYGSTAIRYIRVQNVLGALVLVTVIVGVLALCVLPFVKGVLAYVVAGLPVACVLNLIAAWWYFAIKDPSRLQNEEHIERMAEFTVATMREGEALAAVQRAMVKALQSPTEGVDEASDGPTATTPKDLRAHVLIYNSTLISADDLKGHLAGTFSMSNWVDIGLKNVLFVLSGLTTRELVDEILKLPRVPNVHVVAIEVADSWGGQAPQALWDMLHETATATSPVAAPQALDAHPRPG